MTKKQRALLYAKTLERVSKDGFGFAKGVMVNITYVSGLTWEEVEALPEVQCLLQTSGTSIFHSDDERLMALSLMYVMASC